ncbi:MAG TPA: acyl carrier protein [Thermoanaerobaculales bacterium]|nr:acyl carrier protein [Thermoanaerobaculales bacterium]HPA83110.1 acyl carrier protein [Thermoanaerobaculales bacterium]HQL31215.1 acyl carrier protein [Thermoanaerobaculales bacterium]HQP43725.1 acyl carrier protein [Thermoanaerobaculales bacterium]
MSITETALAVIARVSKVDIAEIRPDMDLVADLGFDSAKALELLVELEEAIGIEISDEQAAGLNSVGDILAVAETMQPPTQPPRI